MICTVCGKNKASIFIRQVVSGKVKEFYICKDCAYKNRAAMEQSLGTEYVESVFKNLMDAEKKETVQEAQPNKTAVCPTCGTSLDEIKKKKELGCSSCFFYFKDSVLSLMRAHNREIIYTGTLPEKLDTFSVHQLSLQELKEELEKAVAHEHYELAAYFRDAIKNMEA